MVPTYHCAEYLERTLRSVLSQDLGPDAMELVVVDDHSVDDDPERVVRDVGGQRVRFLRQDRNVGHVRTFNRCLTEARGEWVHLLHGDDWVEDGFYGAADRALAERPDLSAFVCRYRHYDDQRQVLGDGPLWQERPGVLDGWLEALAAGQRLQAPSTAVRRRVYEAVGGFDLGIAGYGEDWEMWLRVAADGPVWWEPEPLAVYRVRPGSLSSSDRLRSNMADLRRVLALNAQTLDGRLPPERVEALTVEARRSQARALLRRGRRAVGNGEVRAPVTTIVEAVRFSPQPAVLRDALLLATVWAVRSCQRWLRAVRSAMRGPVRGQETEAQAR